MDLGEKGGCVGRDNARGRGDEMGRRGEGDGERVVCRGLSSRSSLESFLAIRLSTLPIRLDLFRNVTARRDGKRNFANRFQFTVNLVVMTVLIE